MLYYGEMADYHILKRKRKDGTQFYHVAFLSDEMGKNGRPRYRAVENTHIEVTCGKDGRPTKAGLQRAVKAAEAMKKEGKVLASRDNIEQYLVDFWDESKSEYLRSRKAETGRTYSSDYLSSNITSIKKYFIPYCKTKNIKKLKDLNRNKLENWRNWLLFDEDKSPRVVNRTRQSVWTALQYAVDTGMLPYHPGGNVKKVREKNVEKKIFERDELVTLFELPWPDIRAKVAALLAVTSGARLGELRGLQYKNLYLDKGYFDIVSNWQDSEGLKLPKWESERISVPIPDRVITALEALGRLNKWGTGPEIFVFFDVNSPKRPISSSVIRTGLNNAVKAAKLPTGRTFHCFRHTYISLASGKLSPAALRYHVGHSNEITTERYEHVTDDDRMAVKELAENLF